MAINNYVPDEYGGYMLNAEGGGSGSDLPEYSESDAGKVLTVNESGNGVEWAEGGIFWINSNPVPEYEGVYRLDKTFLEIYTAMQNKMLCVITYVYSDDEEYEARHEVVKQTYYNSSDGAVVEADMTFTCSSVNDYPEVAD